MTPAARPLRQRPIHSGLKSALALFAVILIYLWASTSLGVTPAKLFSLQTWENMSDLLIRMGPFYRINTCANAEVVWGADEPRSGKPNPAKVRAVCEEGATLYYYEFELLQEQFTYARAVWGSLMQTLRMAILGAAIGALLAIPFSLLSAQNLIRSRLVYYIVRSILNLIRTIPDLVLAAVMSGAFGLGALPGIMALAIFSFALIAKLLSESVEAIDPGPLEAMQACGANRLQQIRYGVVPQVLPQFLAYTLYVLEVDVRASTILGLVGAGGIGQLLYADLNLLRMRNVGAVIAVMLLTVVLIDLVSSRLRERLV